ncbi:small acid-soluble spore protein (thioredoxin-like protein) [Desulfonispora thiosulfatigenes DSM 11270]|uniref:Protein Tlp homolog n=1 Tax=Desulfonispora thiosulfatigenes DSM 11270 TaxID=656914 RepID=A0A1W1UYE5_DESTI|nr:small acid-soluble spore protein Tlp [Desulfonispora thiosulfatigenes]SMB86152.1 small acid-soluble spore protein (thioredoxin-like protein) [Desulfonispora thiosulfatigenes DSM 11270]
MKKNKPDDRRDNVDKIQSNINNTIENYREAKDMINETDNQTMKNQLIEKNEKRRDALSGMREEIKDEANARQNNLK